MAKKDARRRDKPWKRHLRFTREGKAFSMVTLGVGLAAFNTGNNLLFLVLGLMLSLIVLSGILSEIAIRGIRVSRRLPERAFAGTTCLVEIALHNKKSRAPSYSLEVEDQAQGTPTERRCYFLKVAPGAEQVASYRRTPKRRGRLRLEGFRLATRYPFGIFEKWRNLHDEQELLVYPALLDQVPVQQAVQQHGLEAPTTRVGVGNEVAGLKAYQQGDDARHIHWRRTASLGRLVVHERQSESSSRLLLALDNARPPTADAGWEESFEQAISRAATMAVAAAGRDVSVEIVCRGSRSLRVAAGTPIEPVLRFLALLQAVPAAEAEPFGAFPRGCRVVRLAVGELSEAA